MWGVNLNNEEIVKLVDSSKKLPVVVLIEEIVFPPNSISIQIFVNSVGYKAIKAAELNNGYFLVTSTKDYSKQLSVSNIFSSGSICKVNSTKKMSNEMYYVNCTAHARFKVDSISSDGGNIFWANGNLWFSELAQEDDRPEVLANHKVIMDELSSFLRTQNPGGYDLSKIHEGMLPLYLCGLAFEALKSHFEISERKKFLAENDVLALQQIIVDKFRDANDELFESMESEVVFESEIDQKFREDLDKENKINFLKRKRQSIDQQLSQLGAGEGVGEKEHDLEFLLEKAKLPRDAKEVAQREVKRLKSMHPSSSEYHVIENYLNTLANFPWNKKTKDNLDIVNARQTLDEDHYGIEDVKKTVIHYLAVTKLRNRPSGNILCLSGPPGVGKTSICQSIAKCMGRKYARIGLGGVSDEAEIRGHRKTYVGAMAGKIASTLLKLKVNNPVIVLDEIDKLAGGNHRGNVEAALLEVLDPEQNYSFNDHFLNLGIDLSKVLFIATANDISQISGPLRDRMEIIPLSSYTPSDKFAIAKKYLIPKEIIDNGLSSYSIKFEDDAIRTLIDQYTREAGVRGLRKKISQILRCCAQIILENNVSDILIDTSKVHEFLNNNGYSRDKIKKENSPGVALGLAWTPYGGELLYVESTLIPGSGRVVTTGQLGQVMQESSQLAVSLIKKLNTKSVAALKKSDVHIHFPAGAVPKDGPSAGIALFSALYSLFENKPLNPSLAMTGEISLVGDVLPVGGIKEKILAAHMQGAKTVVIPKDNKKDLDKLPKEILEDKNFNIVTVSKIEDVIDIIFK